MSTLNEDSETRQRILVFPFNLLSHYLRCLVYVRDFEDAEVFFASSEKYNAFVLSESHKTFEVEKFDADKVMACANKFDFSWLNEIDLNRVFDSQVQIINELQPDIVIGDMAPTLSMAADFTGVTHISLLNGYMTKYYGGLRILPKSHPGNRILRLFPRPMQRFLAISAEWVLLRYHHNPFRNLRKKHGLPKKITYLHELEGNLNVIIDDPKIFPQKNLPSTYSYAPSLLYDDGSEEQELLNQLDTNKKSIFISMGSTGDWTKLDYFNDSRFEKFNVITAGDSSNILNAPHIIANQFVNLHKILPLCNLLVCHGGNGTTLFGLKYEIFMLFQTSNFEQDWNVEELVRCGYGKRIEEGTFEEVSGILALKSS